MLNKKQEDNTFTKQEVLEGIKVCTKLQHVWSRGCVPSRKHSPAIEEVSNILEKLLVLKDLSEK